MPANTPNRSYTYATSDDANDLAFISQRLAEQVDADVQGIDADVQSMATSVSGLLVGGGAVALGTLVSNTTAASAETATPLSVTFTAVAGKRYEITLTTRLQGSAVDLRCGARIRRGTTITDPNVGEALTIAGVAGVGITTEYTCYDTPGAGSVTYLVSTVTLGGTGNTSIAANNGSAPSTLRVRAA